MKEPERWLTSRTGPERRLLLAALSEVPSRAAWERTSARLRPLGVVCGAAGTSAATGTSAASGTSVAGTANASAVNLSGLLHSAFIKSVAVGLGVGSLVVVGSQLVQPATESHPPTLSSRAPNPPQSERTIRPQAAGTTVAIPTLPAPSADTRLRSRATIPGPQLDPGESSMPEEKSREPEGAAQGVVPIDHSPPAPVSPRAEPGPILNPSVSRSLEREVSAIAAARQALIRGDANTTLHELSALDAAGGFRVLAQEAALLRVEALAVSGQSEAAAALARQLLKSGVAEAHRGRLEQLSKD